MVKKQQYSDLEFTPWLNIYLVITPLNAKASKLTILELKILKRYRCKCISFIKLILF